MRLMVVLAGKFLPAAASVGGGVVSSWFGSLGMLYSLGQWRERHLLDRQLLLNWFASDCVGTHHH